MQNFTSLRRALPRPGQLQVNIRSNLRLLLLSDAINNLTRRVENELMKHSVDVNCVRVTSPDDVTNAVMNHSPDLVVCPFLKTLVPENTISKERPILIMHPGIPGDRGASSLDWAILERQKQWGVTVLDASPVVDGGHIWSTSNFPVPETASKTSLYNGQVSDAAVRCIVDAVSRFCQGVPPQSPENHPEVVGTFKRNMKHSDRTIDWAAPAEDIVTRVRMSDTTPGALGHLCRNNLNRKLRLFDAHLENGGGSQILRQLLNKAKPGELVARRNKSLLIKAGNENGVWVGQLKENTKTPTLKLPALDALPELQSLPVLNDPCSCDDIKIRYDGPVCYVYFDFYNGAMDTQQGARLKRVLQAVDSNPNVKVVALMGGERFFSTGIHLCVIENSSMKEKEAWLNINAIDDVIETVKNMMDKVTVAVLRGNAGAGGAMMAAACDLVVSHPGVLLTPSYAAMHLYGSEYWTYFLPNRVGRSRAQALVSDTTPISAEYAKSMGLVDDVIGQDKSQFEEEVPDYLSRGITNAHAQTILEHKAMWRNDDWLSLLKRHREYELSHMKECFRSEQFLTAMKNFVYKLDNV